jgi:hypothetical protein|tara:strand:+ start:391 stop:666 length:276 start_codon:yes stop_codon:yes gene_type:complete
MRRRRMHGKKRRSCPMKKQELSPQAAKAKAERDLAAAKTDDRKNKKAENQRLRRAALKKGVDLTGKDYDHTKGKFVSVKSNRGNYGKGTRT